MADTLSSDLLARYLSGEASDADRAEVEAWASVAENRRELDQLRALWHQAPEQQWNVEDAWQRVSARLDAPQVVEFQASRRGLGWEVALAAAVVLAIGAGTVWRVLRTDQTTPVSVVATTPGERRTVNLPDGTEVILAPESELRVSADYGTDARRVALRGEAWFAVEHDSERPFTVETAGTITEDLGTEFLVQELPAGRGVRVALVTGVASLRRAGVPATEATVLAPNDIAELAPGESAARVQGGASLTGLVAWTQGRLEFEDARLAAVAADLARWYGIPVVLSADTLAERRFSGTLRLESLIDALEVLRLSLNLQLERRADTLVIR